MRKKIAIWGASITEGFYDLEAGGWVDRIKQHVKFNDVSDVYNLGISSDDTHDILDRFDTEAKNRKPGTIVFSVGNNDSAFLIEEKRHRVEIDQFEKNISLLIEKAQEYTKDIFCACITPVDEDVCNPWRGLMLYKNEYLKQYNDKILEVCKNKNIKTIELFEVFEQNDYKKLLHDGLHPNSAGHKLIFEIVKKNLDL